MHNNLPNFLVYYRVAVEPTQGLTVLKHQGNLKVKFKTDHRRAKDFLVNSLKMLKIKMHKC